jgi:GNAT superfamily N-acetyltransferase
MSDDGVEIVRGSAELIDELRPLWIALTRHHADVAPQLGPVRGEDDSWRRRRAQYQRWLAEDPRNFFLLARRDRRAIGYAFGLLADSSSPTWEGDDLQVLDVETLSVLPEARGAGVGQRLLQGMRDEVAARGYDRLTLTVVSANRDALRFYEREGFAPAFTILRDTRGTP